VLIGALTNRLSSSVVQTTQPIPTESQSRTIFQSGMGLLVGCFMADSAHWIAILRREGKEARECADEVDCVIVRAKRGACRSEFRGVSGASVD
jgi:hypothetical protein